MLIQYKGVNSNSIWDWSETRRAIKHNDKGYYAW